MAKRKPRIVSGSEMLVTKFPTMGTCRHCGATVLVGILWGMPEKYDPYPLNEWGELEAKLRGAKTFYMDHPHFRYRTSSMIRKELVPKFGGIVRQHICGAPRPDDKFLSRLEDTQEDWGECPY